MATNAYVSGGAASHGAALSGLNAPAAPADIYTGPAISALNSGQHTYADSTAGFANAGAVSGAYSNGQVAVVSLPSAAVSTLSPTDVANQILAGTHGYNTVIVMVEGNSIPFGVAGANSNAIANALYSAKASNASPESVVIQQSGNVEKLSTQTISQTGGGTAPTGAPIGPILGGVSGVVGVLVVASVIALVVNRVKAGHRSAKVTTKRDESVYVPATKFSKYLPEQLAVLAKQLDDLGRKHSKINNDHLTPQIAKIINNLQELFNRIHKQSGDGTNNARLAEVEYVDKLKKLTEALGDDYYLDIAAKPDLWDNPEERLKAVDDAVDAVGYQLVENIKQVNASKDLKFQVALDSLMASKAPTVNDIYESNKPFNLHKKKTDPTIS